MGEDVQLGLRQAFAAEVAARLPRLEGFVATGRSGTAEESLAALRDVHTLASSAVIVGEAEIAALARAVEDDPVTGPLDQLVGALRAWQRP